MWPWLLAAVLILLCIRSEYEKKHFSVERTVIETEKIKRDCTLVFLSDLHNNEFGQENETLLQAVYDCSPDLVVIGGDMMICKGRTGVGIPLHLIGELAKRYPVYCGNGNHEVRMKQERETYGDQYDEYAEALKSSGAVLLSDARALFRDDLDICAIDLQKESYRKFSYEKLEPSTITEVAGPANADKFQLLLCHSPLYFDVCREWGADLTLAGHFHGGTIRLPYLGGVMTPQYQFFLPWCAGEFEENSRHMIVSRGLGTHSINIRLNNKPQVVVVKLKKKPTF